MAEPKQKMSWDGPVMQALLNMKADLLNIPENIGKKSFLAFLRGEDAPDVESFLRRLHADVNAAIDAASGQKNYLFNGSVRRVTADEIRKQLMEKSHGG